MTVRVRFAPSPTGYLHIGSARTALFNWLFAKANKGKFLIRIEDTDTARSNNEYLNEILDSLRWMGLDWDEEPVHQSARFDVYRKYADGLLKKKKAYKEENGAIIMPVPEGKVVIEDLVHGRIEFDLAQFKDVVLIKGDGTPTYNFACVVDDALMKITHVIRGDDHISNTPKQILVYDALRFKKPKFAHIPLILGTDKSRMSKRHGATSIKEYKEQGFLSSALVNFISLLGWSPGGDREIMSREEIIKEFSLKNINKAGAVFDIDKLTWMNSQYIANLSDGDFFNLLLPELKKHGWVKEGMDTEWLIKAAALFKVRTQKLNDFFDSAGYVFTDEIQYDQKAVDKRLKKEKVPQILKEILTRFSQLDIFDAKTTEDTCRKLADEMGIKPAEIIHPLRVAVSGRMAGPGLFELLETLGKDRVIKRLEDKKW